MRKSEIIYEIVLSIPFKPLNRKYYGAVRKFYPSLFFNLLVVIAVTLLSIIEADEGSKSVTIPFEQN